MKLACKECGVLFTSLLVDPQQAAMEIGQKFLEHSSKKHNAKTVEVFTKAAMLSTVMNWILLVKELSINPDDRLNRQMKLQEETITKALGLGLGEAKEEAEEKPLTTAPQ